MYRILALLLLLSVVLFGCAPEPTPTPTAEPLAQPTEVPTLEPTAVPEPTATDVPTVAPTDTPPPTNTPTPVTGIVKSTLNVREQPTTRATLLGVLKKDDVVTLVGRTEDLSWLNIAYPLGESTTAWVIAERIDTTASLEALPAIVASPTAAATQVAVQPTSSVPTSVTTTAETPAATASAETPQATITATGEATATVQATTVPAETPQPPAAGGTPAGSILFDVYENGGFNIYKVRADGTGLQQIIPNASEPALSPDGSSIAYRMRRDVGGLGIAIASSTGAYLRTLTEESAAGYPSWSADGNNLAYNIVPSNERIPATLVRIGASEGNTPVPIGDGWRPAWQPNASSFLLFDGCKGATDCGSILTLNGFEGDPNNPNLITLGSAGAWSPNSQQIAFQAPDANGNTQIWIVNGDGSGRTQVTTDIGTHGMPIWSSDGQWLFYRTDQGGLGWALYAIRTNGTDARKIVDANVHPVFWTNAKLAIAP